MSGSRRRRMSSQRFVVRAAALSGACSLFANCSIHEHEPVVSDAGNASGGKLGASGNAGASAKTGGKAGASGGAGRASGGAETAEAGGVGASGGEHAGSGGASGEAAGAGGVNDGGGVGGVTNEAGGTSSGAAGRANGGSTGGGVSKGGATGNGGTTGTGGTSGTGGTGAGGTGTGGTATGGSSHGGATSCVAKDVGPTGPSCSGLANNCGSGESCCTSLCVPGGLFVLGGNVETRTSQARVSGFYLDKYEVSVGRFRQFVSAYEAWLGAKNPKNGAAAHPLIAGSGWQATAWMNSLPATSAALIANVTTNCSPQHDGAYSTWSASGANDNLPINCLNWFEAFAFCDWDGGRLPTEAEWEYAAAAGDQGNVYPWGPQLPTSERASYDCLDGPLGCADIRAIVPVGSKPKGAGFFGHVDLAGSVQEWVLDWYSTPYPSTMNDDAVVENDPQHVLRVYRGSSWGQSADELKVAIRWNEEPQIRGSYIGLRCARPSAVSP